MANHLDKWVSLATAAREVGMAKSSIHRRFIFHWLRDGFAKVENQKWRVKRRAYQHLIAERDQEALTGEEIHEMIKRVKHNDRFLPPPGEDSMEYQWSRRVHHNLMELWDLIRNRPMETNHEGKHQAENVKIAARFLALEELLDPLAHKWLELAEIK
jgi:hypothetical protein